MNDKRTIIDLKLPQYILNYSIEKKSEPQVKLVYHHTNDGVYVHVTRKGY